MLEFILHSMFWVVIWLVPNALVLWVVYFVLSLPLRRQERARFFLDLLEGCLDQGKTPERGIVELSATRDRSLGVRFHWLAALLESGVPLQQALRRVPGFLPLRTQALLEAGAQLGRLGQVLPVCRRVTTDAMSAVQGAGNYVILALLAISPAAVGVLAILSTFVLPKFFAIADDMEVMMPPLLQWLTLHRGWFNAGMISLCVFVDGFVLLYVAGPYLGGWLRRCEISMFDALTWMLPWRRRRLQRDFVALLALLLDEEMSEVEAVSLAAASIPHEIIRARARRAGLELEQGRHLVRALRHLDDSGDLSWRLENASASRHGFREALEGWLEALDARAYQQEQVAAQFTTTGLVLVNGGLVGLLVIGVFQPLIAIIDAAVLW
jgi:type II secretory pathway component PulF